MKEPCFGRFTITARKSGWRSRRFPGIRASYAHLTELLEEFGLELRMPHSRAMGGGLFELRLRGREGIARVFYCTRVGRRIVVLHSFVKKTQETPSRELQIARRRQPEVE